MHVLSISALKGGVRKTTITLGLASAAMAKGLRTLVVDLDPQCNASNGLGAVGDFETNVAKAIKKPRHNTVLKAILVSTWAKGQARRLDVLVGTSELNSLNITNPSFKSLWKLEEALATVQADYDLVLIDTPPNINALTRMAWVASDRVMLVTEPSVNSIMALDRGLKALMELRKQVNRQVSLFGILVNRLRPTLAEHQYRVNEVEELYAGNISSVVIEEKSALTQAQGAGRSIHTWPGQSAAKLAGQFDLLLDEVLQSFAAEDLKRLEQPKSNRDRNRYAHRTREVADLKKLKGRRSAANELAPQPDRVEMVDTKPVSPEYEDKWNEILRQTMTEKQIKALTETDEEN